MGAIRYLIEIGDPITHRFSTAVRSPITPYSSNYPYAAGGSKSYPVRLEVPTLKKKISDSISGTTILPQFTFVIQNDDGKYDDVETLGWFNTPVTLKRSDIDNPTIEDFSTIFYGMIDYPIVTQTSVRLVCNNTYRSLTEDVCKTFNTTDYPNIPDGSKDKFIPIAYGPTIKNVPLFEIDSTDTTKFIAIDPDYLTSVSAVYDEDGNSLTFSVASGVITEGTSAAKTADVVGAPGNTIGEIIVSEVATKSGISFNATNWDILEVNQYISNCGTLNFYFSGGSVRQLCDAVLKSDNAFFFDKNDGRLTIRQWGREYTIHTLSNTRIMNFPKKDFKEALKYYNSLAIVQYDMDVSEGSYQKQLSSGITPSFSKEKTVTYPTDLYDQGQILDLADRMIKRFGFISELLPIESGDPAITIDLLDEVQVNVSINGRQLSTKTKWIVREVDPGQDTMVLEAKSGFLTPAIIDGILSQPGYYNGSFIDGVLSQPLSYNSGAIDGVLSQPLVSTGVGL